MGRVRLSRRMGEGGMRGRVFAKMAMGVAGCAAGALVLSIMSSSDAENSVAGESEHARALQSSCSRFSPYRDGEFNIQGTALCDDAQGWLPLAIFLMIYMFWALAVVVDELFVPTLDFIVLELGIDEDVAGATFMAAGGSAPEFFTNMISVIEVTGTGFGTIVGSAIFNILFVISMSAFFSRDRDEVVRRRDLAERGKVCNDPWPYSPLPLTWWPLLRDSTVYVLGLSVLAIFYFCITGGLLPGGTCATENGGLIMWYEALILFLMYVAYCVLMGFQAPVKKFVENYMTFLIPRDQRLGGARHALTLKDAESGTAGAAIADDAVVAAVPPLQKAGSHASESSLGSTGSGRTPKLKALQQQASVNFHLQGAGEPGAPRRVSFANALSRRGLLVNDDLGRKHSITSHEGGAHVEGEDEDEENMEVVIPRMRPTSFAGDPARKDDVMYRIGNALLYMLVLPILLANVFVFFDFDTLVAMENRTKKRVAGTYAFFMSLVWIALYTWIMVYAAETMAATWGIPDTILGFTILAAGTSTPDLLSSVFVARLGYGDMAVSSSIGSNIFDILVGLPVPWLVSILINDKPLPVATGAVGYSLAVIILMVISLVAIIIWQDWKLTHRAAAAMLVLYFVFLTAVIAAELA